MTGVEHLTDRQEARLDEHLPAGDPSGEVRLAWQTYQRLRAIYHVTGPDTGRRLAEQLIDVVHTCAILELARLGRTLRQWRTQIMAHFATGGVNKGGTEAINGVIEKTRRRAYDFRNFENHRLRILLAADGTPPYRTRPTHAGFKEPVSPQSVPYLTCRTAGSDGMPIRFAGAGCLSR